MSMILACACDENGSEDQLCDKDSGQCTCHPYVEGLKCEKGKLIGYYSGTSQLTTSYNSLSLKIHGFVSIYKKLVVHRFIGNKNASNSRVFLIKL